LLERAVTLLVITHAVREHVVGVAALAVASKVLEGLGVERRMCGREKCDGAKNFFHDVLV
jgi:hypothetical protein